MGNGNLLFLTRLLEKHKRTPKPKQEQRQITVFSPTWQDDILFLFFIFPLQAFPTDSLDLRVLALTSIACGRGGCQLSPDKGDPKAEP